MTTRILGGLAFVLAVAFALRAFQLQEVPQVTDESAEVLFAWDIAFEGAHPLTHTDSYNGPLWPYLMAVTLRTLGPSIELPRRFTLAFGLATVAAAFSLGALLVPPSRRAAAGVIAGLVMAANYTHTLVGSRIAWSNSTTPFWTTLAAIAFVLAVREPGSVRRWAGAGLLAGLALNTHPSVAIFVIGLAVWWLLVPARRSEVRRAGPWVALVAALAAYSPVVVHNLVTSGDTFSQAAASRNVEAHPGLAAWVENVGAMTLQLGRSLGGGFAAGGAPIWGAGVLVFVVAAVWLLVASASAPHNATSGRRLPLVVFACSALLLPLVNRNWVGFLEARYLTYLVPLLGAAAAVALTTPEPRWRRAVSAACALVLVIVPAARSGAYVVDGIVDDIVIACHGDCEGVGSLPFSPLDVTPRGRTNRQLLDMVAEAESAQRKGAQVLVDRELKELAWPNRGDPRRAVTYYLTLAEVPYEVATLDKIRHFVAQGSAVAAFLAETSSYQLGDERLLEPLIERRLPGYPVWGVYETAVATLPK